MMPSRLRAPLMSLALLLVAPATLAAAEEAEHHGPLQVGEVLANPQFWAAALNFALLLIILRRMGGRPLAEFLRNRRREMERSINEAAEMKQKAEAKYQEYTDRLTKLDDELAKLRGDIERAAQDDKQRIVAEAEETALRFKRETESLIEQHAKALSAGVRREAVEAALAAAEQQLHAVLTAADQQRLADAFRQRVGSRRADEATSPVRAPVGPRPEERP